MSVNVTKHLTGKTRYFCFHGLTIELIADDPDLIASIHSRLRHFAVGEQFGKPDIVFEYRHVVAAGHHWVEKPNIPMRRVYEPTLGEVVYSDDEDLLFLELGEQFRALCLPQEGRVRVSILGKRPDNTWLPSHPLFTLPFIEILKRRARYSIHAAGFCLNTRGLLFPGTSGAGKSTLSLALLRAGFGFLGDDMLFLAAANGRLNVSAFPDEIDVTEETVGFFPELQAVLQGPGTSGWQKRQVLAEKAYKTDLPSECEPAILLFPTVTNGQRSGVKSMSRDEALMELAPNVLLTEYRSSQAHLDALSSLVKQTTAYRLDFGRDFNALEGLMRTLTA